MSADYRLVDSTPAEADYLHLRKAAGLTPRSPEQARLALPGSWAACHVVHVATGESVAMGRAIGDGGWYFHVADVAVLPEHQRHGLGSLVLSHLLEVIGRVAPPGADVSLMADVPGRRLYERHGFAEAAPASVGMALVLGDSS